VETFQGLHDMLRVESRAVCSVLQVSFTREHKDVDHLDGASKILSTTFISIRDTLPIRDESRVPPPRKYLRPLEDENYYTKNLLLSES